MENENMNYYEENEIAEVETDTDETKSSGMSTGVAMLIGTGLTIATGGLIKLGKKLYMTYKAKKESKKSEEETCDEVAD